MLFPKGGYPVRDTVIDYIIENNTVLINKTLQGICQDYCISLAELKSRERTQFIVEARQEAYRKLKAEVGLNSQVIGKILGRHRSAVERGQSRKWILDHKMRDELLENETFQRFLRYLHSNAGRVQYSGPSSWLPGWIITGSELFFTDTNNRIKSIVSDRDRDRNGG